VVGELVPGHPDQPRDRRIGRARHADRAHGGQERLGGEVLGQAGIAAAGQQVAVDVRQRIVVQLEQPERRVGPHLRVRHTLIVARAPHTPTGSAELTGRRFPHEWACWCQLRRFAGRLLAGMAVAATTNPGR
jgi:hypothetical protein